MPGAGFEPATMRSSAVRERIETAEIRFSDINKEDFILFWTTERKQKTERKRAEKLYRVLEKVLKGKLINEETLRQGFHETTNKKDYVNAARVLLDYLKARKLMPKNVIEDILEQPFLTPIKSKRREVEIFNKHIVAAYNWIKEKWDEDTVMLYKLLVYSGIRLGHALKMLKTFDPDKLQFKGKVARYPIKKITTEVKSGEYAFIPAKFAKSLRKLKIELDESSWENRINPRRWKPEKPEWQKSPVDANAIRHWFGDFCQLNGASESATEYFL
ncbi:hypothetical protein DRO97_09595, partial [Archaeoglobales archaeon]